ncbi:MAG: Crp/Fnr family transcriptional regulator [Gammaproteobacteria bacterium]
MSIRPDRLTAQQCEQARTGLGQCLLFARLDTEEFEQILSHTRLIVLAEHQCLFEQQQPAREIFLLHSGQVKLALISTEGHEKVIDLIAPGASFAEAVMFSGTHVYPVTATALVRSEVWGIDAATYEGILRQSTDACFAVMAKMSMRLHWQVAEIDRLTLHNAAFRVISYLLEQVPSTHLHVAQVQLDAPKHVIASRLSITPETLSRIFSRLSKEGYIDIAENAIRISDIERLRSYLQSGDIRPA